jgi:hypothetical protein
MIRILLALPLFAGAILAQEQQWVSGSTASPVLSLQSPAMESVPAPVLRPDSQPAVTVSEETPVITVHGLCPVGRQAPAGDHGACARVVTRKQFDSLVTALTSAGQTISRSSRRDLARLYVDLLAYEDTARKAGIEDSSSFQEAMDWLRLRTLADIYRRNLQEQYRNPSQQDIDEFYSHDADRFTEIKLKRVTIPRINPSGQGKEEFERRALEVINQLHERALKGEDLGQLQKDGYVAMGLTISPPAISLGTLRRAAVLPEEAAEIFSLEAGGFSQVEHEIYSFVFYKLEGKRLLPKEQVKDEIVRELFRERMEKAIQSITGAVQPELNDEYFGPAPGQSGRPTVKEKASPGQRPD